MAPNRPTDLSDFGENTPDAGGDGETETTENSRDVAAEAAAIAGKQEPEPEPATTDDEPVIPVEELTESDDGTDQDDQSGGVDSKYAYEDVDEVEGMFQMEDWPALFPYDEPYDDQKAAIANVMEEIDRGGFSMLEAACGTGKTLISLMAAVSAVRDPTTNYERVFATTSVKQQLRAFEDDLEAINANLPAQMEPVSALSMVGKADLCAYTDAGTIDDDEIYTACDDLRDPVRTVAGTDNAEKSLENMVDRADVSTAAKGDHLGTDEWESPFHGDFPNTSQDGSGNDYCPFYANYRLETLDDDEGYVPMGVVRPWDLMSEAADEGMCPHAVLMDGIANAEVVIGNFMHIFDPLTTEAMTGELIGPETIVVGDEAHNIVPKVRDLLSDSVAHTTINRARDEIQNRILELPGEPGRVMEDELQKKGISVDDLREFRTFLGDLWEHINDIAIDHFDSVDEYWHEHPTRMPDEMELSLRDPETVEVDDLTEWAIDEGYEGVLEQASRIRSAVKEGFEVAGMETDFHVNETYTDTIARVVGRWYDLDHETYFRQIEFSQLDYKRNADVAWANHYTASLKLRNCIPSKEIADVLNEFGAGLLMSATLAPLDVYAETVGIEQLAERGRSTQQLTYSLSFPEENRYSAAVPLTKFTSSNQDRREVKDAYFATAKTVVSGTAGNTLVAMPNYSLAMWIGERLKMLPSVDKSVKIDGSDVDSEELKSWFFEGEGKVVVTGLRGTLTEGVDYDGDRLESAIVCGVPIRNLGGDYPDAIRLAYDQEFGSSNGFDYAFSVPAVRKTRQALGRVIRGSDETGVRVVADRRYAQDYQFDDVRGHLPEYDQADYQPVEGEDLADEIQAFWEQSW